MSLETSAAIIAVSLAILTLITVAVLILLFILIRQTMTLVSTVKEKAVPIMESARHTAETVRHMGESARFQVQRLESLGSQLARRDAVYSALSHGVVVAVATLLRRRGV